MPRNYSRLEFHDLFSQIIDRHRGTNHPTHEDKLNCSFEEYLGMDDLNVIELIIEIEKELDIQIPICELCNSVLSLSGTSISELQLTFERSLLKAGRLGV
jgi:acyl carrier protein